MPTRTFTDQERAQIVLSSFVNRIAEKTVPARFDLEEAADFMQRLFNDYLESGNPLPTVDWIDSGAPKSTESWIRSYLETKFQNYKRRPKWIDEPSWLFDRDGMPLQFVESIALPLREGESNRVKYVFARNLEDLDEQRSIIQGVEHGLPYTAFPTE